MSTQPQPIPNQAAILREEYMAAHETSMRRALIFENGDRQVEYVNNLLMTITFYIASDADSVQDIFTKNIESNADSVQILDYLHDFMQEFTFRLMAHDPRLVKLVRDMVATSIAVNHPMEHTSTLPGHYVDGMVSKGEVEDVFNGNAWYYALAVMRLFGGHMLTDVSLPPRAAR